MKNFGEQVIGGVAGLTIRVSSRASARERRLSVVASASNAPGVCRGLAQCRAKLSSTPGSLRDSETPFTSSARHKRRATEGRVKNKVHRPALFARPHAVDLCHGNRSGFWSVGQEAPIEEECSFSCLPWCMRKRKRVRAWVVNVRQPRCVRDIIAVSGRGLSKCLRKHQKPLESVMPVSPARECSASYTRRNWMVLNR